MAARTDNISMVHHSAYIYGHFKSGFRCEYLYFQYLKWRTQTQFQAVQMQFKSSHAIPRQNITDAHDESNHSNSNQHAEYYFLKSFLRVLGRINYFKLMST